MKRSLVALITVTLMLASVNLFAQARSTGGRGGAPPEASNAKAMAPFDITGYWVSAGVALAMDRDAYPAPAVPRVGAFTAPCGRGELRFGVRRLAAACCRFFCFKER